MTGPDEVPRLGARPHANGCSFAVWAPAARRVELLIESQEEQPVAMNARAAGYHTVDVPGIASGARYRYALDGGQPLPDPASRLQPEGVHGPSAVVSMEFPWTDREWAPPRPANVVLYELHVGTFSQQGTFDAAIPFLTDLHDLGITAVELMPICEFPGARNWGYDGVLPFSAHHAYGGPDGLRRFIDAAHAAGLAVYLDVVYNHLGPEGNYLAAFGPYFTDRYRTPWGDALNFDGEHSDHVREFFVQSAIAWMRDYHIDGFRLDAVHAIHDASAHPFLQELVERVRAAAAGVRRVHIIAESDSGDPRVIRPIEAGGLGCDAQWIDDFHHALHTVQTAEQHGYYEDFGRLDQLAEAYRAGYVYKGQYSRYRRRSHGAPPVNARPIQMVAYAQTHDQIGNRAAGDRLAATLDFDRLRLTAAAVLFSPFVPLLFMGEEYGERAPFPYFISHGDESLVEAVRLGRRAEFAAFDWAEEPPDPQAEKTFASARLDRSLAQQPGHRELLAFYRTALSLRSELGLVGDTAFPAVACSPHERWVRLHRAQAWRVETVTAFNFSALPATVPLPSRGPRAGTGGHAPPLADWRVRLDSAAAEWTAPGNGRREMDASYRTPSNRTTDGGPAIELQPFSAMVLTYAG